MISRINELPHKAISNDWRIARIFKMITVLQICPSSLMLIFDDRQCWRWDEVRRSLWLTNLAVEHFIDRVLITESGQWITHRKNFRALWRFARGVSGWVRRVRSLDAWCSRVARFRISAQTNRSLAQRLKRLENSKNSKNSRKFVNKLYRLAD